MVATIFFLGFLLQSLGELRDPATGVSLRLIDGWTANAPTHGGDRETAIALNDPRAEANLAVFYFHPVKSTTEESLISGIPAIIDSRARAFGDIHLRQGSVTSRVFAGHPSVSFVADYSEKAKLMAEYVVQLGDDKTGVIFFARMPVEALATFRPRFDKLIETLQLPATAVTFQSTNRTVNINVIAVDGKGQPVTDLNRSDFSITDNGQVRPVTLFSRETSASRVRPAEAPRVLPPNTFSNKGTHESAAATVILFDGLNTPEDQQANAKLKIISYLKSMNSSSPIALYFLGNELTLIHDFTQDSQSLINAVNRKSVRPNMEMADSSPEPANVGTDPRFNMAINMFNAVIAERAMRERGMETAAALRTIKASLSHIPGRKNLIWVAGSFPAGSGGFNDIAVYPMSTLGLETGMVSLEGRSGQPDVNLGAAPVYRPPVEPFREFAETLAADTGGRLFYGVNDLAGAVRSVINDSQASYAIAFSPPAESLDQKQHALKVTVNRPGVSLRYRKKYLASPDLERPSLEDAVTSRTSSPAIGFDVEMKADGGTLKAHIRVDPHGITFTEQAGKWDVSLLVIAGSTDKKAPVIPVHMSLNAEQYAGVQKNGFELVQDMPGKAGEYLVAIQDTPSGQIGTLRFTR